MSYYYVFNTDRGWVALAGRDGKLVRSTLPKNSREEALANVQAGLGEDCVEDHDALATVAGKLADYFAGKSVDLSTIEIDVSSQPPFIATVQRACQKIPYGTLMTYRDLAAVAGNPRASRAAGTAMAKNLLPIIVPCHRVVASGGIGGFALGLEWKRTLLRLEGVDI